VPMKPNDRMEGKQMERSAARTLFSVRSSVKENDQRARFLETFHSSPISPPELLYSQLTLYLSRQELSRTLALADLYRNYVPETNGVLMEFGTCYGRTAALLTNLRGIFEPFNFTRKLIVFDTFTGLRGTGEKDGDHEFAQDGAYSSEEGYQQHLSQVLAYHESESPIAHRTKFEIVVGDASRTVGTYLAAHPETIVAMAYFDMDIYEPTKACLEAIRPHLVRNSVLAFDQLNCPEYPGETLALAEVFGLSHCSLRRSPLSPWMSYTTCEAISS
jgi:hypothetical protein